MGKEQRAKASHFPNARGYEDEQAVSGKRRAGSREEGVSAWEVC